MSKKGKTSVSSRDITHEDVIGVCKLIDLDPYSPELHQLHPLLQTFAAGSAWAALANLAGLDAIPASSGFDFATPVEIGDTITAIAEADEKTQEGLVKFRLRCQNQRGELVLEGWALLGQSLDPFVA